MNLNQFEIKNILNDSCRLSNPLVTILVITYNSSKYVLETLESAKAQQYHNIELIVSDDGSSDNTVELCKVWLETNKNRFVKTELITIEKNTGTPSNCNRGLKVAQGEWVKLIAGDDILHEDYLMYLADVFFENNINIAAGTVCNFEDDINIAELSWPNFDFPQDFTTQKMTQIVHGLLLAPSVILRTSKLVSLGGFDEDFLILEDDPLWIKIYEDGNLCKFVPEAIVFYRQHLNSVNSTMTRAIYYRKPIFLMDSIKFGFKLRLPKLAKYNLYGHFIILFFVKNLEFLIYMRKSRLDNKFNFLLSRIIAYLNRLYYWLPVK